MQTSTVGESWLIALFVSEDESFPCTRCKTMSVGGLNEPTSVLCFVVLRECITATGKQF